MLIIILMIKFENFLVDLSWIGKFLRDFFKHKKLILPLCKSHIKPITNCLKQWFILDFLLAKCWLSELHKVLLLQSRKNSFRKFK